MFYVVGRKSKTTTGRPASGRTSRGRQAQSDTEALARRDRIIDVAIRLAEEGGFENVRQRDVAAQAGVALGTLYKSFRGKGDILSAALHRETLALEERLARRPAKGRTALDRLESLFQTLTRALLRKPNYARALLRAMTSSEPEVTANVVAHQIHVTRMVLGAFRGPDNASLEEQPPSHEELRIALLLQQIWFAALVGWSAKLNGKARIVEQVREAAELLLAGAAALAATAQPATAQAATAQGLDANTQPQIGTASGVAAPAAAVRQLSNGSKEVSAGTAHAAGKSARLGNGVVEAAEQGHDQPSQDNDDEAPPGRASHVDLVDAKTRVAG